MWHNIFAVSDSGPVGQSIPDIVLQSRGLRGGSGEIDALDLFNLHNFLWPACSERLEEISHCIDVYRSL